jgi:hypothetical protein
LLSFSSLVSLSLSLSTSSSVVVVVVVVAETVLLQPGFRFFEADAFLFAIAAALLPLAIP